MSKTKAKKSKKIIIEVIELDSFDKSLNVESENISEVFEAVGILNCAIRDIIVKYTKLQ